MNAEELISCSLDIGEKMLLSGAEVGRVEDSVRLICEAYGCKRVDVFTITSSMVVTLVTGDDRHITQTRRIRGGQTNLTRLDRLNDLSRRICREKPDYQTVQRGIAAVMTEKKLPLLAEALASALIAAAFAVFFGGSLYDGLAAAILGFLTRYCTWLLARSGMNQVFINAAATFVLCLTTAGLLRLGIGHDPDKLIIGFIMLLIPGVALTNALRDLISGDTMSGLLRFFDALLGAGAIAAGYLVAGWLLGGGI